MPLTVRVKSSDDATGKHREGVSKRVIEQFGNSLPEVPILCFLDDEIWPEYKGPTMAANRGIYFHDPPWVDAPEYIRDCAFVDDHRRFENLIYLHGTTCVTDVGLAMTFAHELQHFVQHSNALTAWAANMVAFVTLRTLDPAAFSALGIRSCDIPFEREARIVAKRVTEALFGAESVHEYIQSKIAEKVTEQDVTDWECIRELDASAPYDLAAATRIFFPKLETRRSELERAFRSLQARGDADFLSVDLHTLLSVSLSPLITE